MSSSDSLLRDARSMSAGYAMRIRTSITILYLFLNLTVHSYSFSVGISPFRRLSSRHNMVSNTYIPLLVTTPRIKRKTTILVKKGEEKVINTIESWLNEGINADEKQIDAWCDEGLVFRSTPLGVRAMHLAEDKEKKLSQTIRKPSVLKYALDMYIQVGTESEPAYVRASKSASVPDLKSGVTTIEQLRRTGNAFTNVTQLFIDERVTNRANSIANRLNDDFSIVSPEWRTWVNKTAQYNATTLKQVLAAYYQEESIGDVGGKDAKYVPKRGHPGTLAPGENFKENNPFEELPNRVLHPWPAMQEFQFHVRWAPNHPMLPPPLLYFGLNNMYTDNFTNWQLSLPYEEIVGGLHMEAKDAIRISKFCTIGMSYDPSEQLEHGGMIFPGRHVLANYNPDHGPTISDEKSKPPVPRELLPFSNRWVDPFFDLEQFHTKDPVEEELSNEAASDEAVRRAAAEQMLNNVMQPNWVEKDVLDGEKFESEVADRVASWTSKQKKKRQETAEEYGVSEEDAEEEDDEALRILTEDAAKARRDVENEKAVIQVVLGKARGERALITYTIEAVRDMTFEILRTEKDMATHKKSGRRKKRKDKTSAVVVPSLDPEDAAGEPIDSGEGFEAQEGALGGDGDADMMSSPGAEVEIADSTD